MSSKPYCGYNSKPPKNQHLGTQEECKKLNQLRRYGRIKVKHKKLPIEKAITLTTQERKVRNLSRVEIKVINKRVNRELTEQLDVLDKILTIFNTTRKTSIQHFEEDTGINYDSIISIIKGFDLYPTPLEYGKKIFKLDRPYKNSCILDAGAGLLSLSLEFIKHYKRSQRIDFVEITPYLGKIIKNVSNEIKHSKTYIKNFMEFNFERVYDIIISNPPFRDSTNDKKFYIPWIFKIFEQNNFTEPIVNQKVYIIMPMTIFFKDNLKAGDSLQEIQSYITYPVFKKIQKKYGLYSNINRKNEYENETFYFQGRLIDDNVTGFKGVAKNGKIIDVKMKFGLFEFILSRFPNGNNVGDKIVKA